MSEMSELARMHWRGWVGLGSMRYSSHMGRESAARAGEMKPMAGVSQKF
jgi:hypothetical protein